MYFFGYARNGFQNWFFRHFYNFSRSLTGGKNKNRIHFFSHKFCSIQKNPYFCNAFEKFLSSSVG